MTFCGICRLFARWIHGYSTRISSRIYSSRISVGGQEHRRPYWDLVPISTMDQNGVHSIHNIMFASFQTRFCLLLQTKIKGQVFKTKWESQLLNKYFRVKYLLPQVQPIIMFASFLFKHVIGLLVLHHSEQLFYLSGKIIYSIMGLLKFFEQR